MHYPNRLFQLVFLMLALAVSSCAPATQKSISYPNPLPTQTETSVSIPTQTPRSGNGGVNKARKSIGIHVMVYATLNHVTKHLTNLK
jgi:hypothetical protein